MHTDSGMTGISLSGCMPYMTVASLEMSDEPFFYLLIPPYVFHQTVIKRNRQAIGLFLSQACLSGKYNPHVVDIISLCSKECCM